MNSLATEGGWWEGLERSRGPRGLGWDGGGGGTTVVDGLWRGGNRKKSGVEQR